MLAPRTAMPGMGCAHYPFIVSITGAAGKEYKSNAREPQSAWDSRPRLSGRAQLDGGQVAHSSLVLA